MSDRPERPQEIRKHGPNPVLANFRPSITERQARVPRDFRKARAGMSAAHLINIRGLECTLCHARDGIQAHHLKSSSAARERGVFMRATDRWATPLCPEHHDSVERIGSRREREWFAAFGIDPHALAQGLWNARSDPIRMDFVLRAHKQQAIRTLSSKRDLVVDLESGEWRRV